MHRFLCGYARDWGSSSAPLFSVRGFSLPALTVELNPFLSDRRPRDLERALSNARTRGNAFVGRG